MTAPTLTKTEAALIEHAQGVRSRVLNIDWPEGEASDAIREALGNLVDVLEKHSDLLNEVIHWDACEWGADLRDFADPDLVALELAAEGADEAAGIVIEVIGKHIGAKAAARVSGEGDEGE